MTKRISVTLHDHILEQLDNKKHKLGISRGELIAMLISKHGEIENE